MISAILTVVPVIAEKVIETSPIWGPAAAAWVASMIGKNPDEARAAVENVGRSVVNFGKGVSAGLSRAIGMAARATDAKGSTVVPITVSPNQTQRTDAVTVPISPAAERLYNEGAQQQTQQNSQQTQGGTTAPANPNPEKPKNRLQRLREAWKKPSENNSSPSPQTPKKSKIRVPFTGYNENFWGNIGRGVVDGLTVWQGVPMAIDAVNVGSGALTEMATQGRRKNTATWYGTANYTPIGLLGKHNTEEVPNYTPIPNENEIQEGVIDN